MRRIVISREAHEAIRRNALGSLAFDDSETIYSESECEIYIDEEVLARLDDFALFGEDYSEAILRLCSGLQ